MTDAPRAAPLVRGSMTPSDLMALQAMAEQREPTRRTCVPGRTPGAGPVAGGGRVPPQDPVGKLIKPGKGVRRSSWWSPPRVEEKFIHDRVPETSEEEESLGGAGEGMRVR